MRPLAPATLCCLQNFLVVVIGVAMMVGKEFVADDIEAPFAQVDGEGGGIADSAEREEFGRGSGDRRRGAGVQ